MRLGMLVAEMTARDILRRRAVLGLLLLVPLAFYLARHGDFAGQSIRFACLGVAWAVSTAALFSANAAKTVEVRLRLAGYQTWQILLGRMAALLGIGLLVAGVYTGIILVDLHPDRPAVIALTLAISVVVAVPLGLAIGVLVPRDLEGMLVLITLIGMQMLIDPAKSSARFLPLWSARELLTYAVDHVDSGYLDRGLAHGLGVAAVLTLISGGTLTWRLRRRAHLTTAGLTAGPARP